MSTSHHRFTPLLLLGFVFAACQDPLVTPEVATPGTSTPRPQFAQGDNGIWTVTSLDDPGNGVCNETECTLRSAIASAAQGDKIVFAAGLEGTILRFDVFLIDETDLTIDGDNRITIDGQRFRRIFDVDGENEDHLFVLRNLTLENGFVTGEHGGSIRVQHGAHAWLENVKVTGSTSTMSGGAISVEEGGELTLINSTLDGNTADASGGGIRALGPVTITGSTISGNSSRLGGGAIALGIGGLATITRSTISGNSTGGNGGGISVGLGTLHVVSSTIVDNTSSDGVGGLYSPTGGATVGNTIIAGNLGQGDCNGNSQSFGHNLVTKTGGCDYFSTGDRRVDFQVLFTQVLEPELQDNGGPTLTHALIVRGLAMDAGSCPGETEDQRGLPRPVDVDVMPNVLDACDIGAYELQGPVVPRSDLMVSQSANKTSVRAGDLLTYTVRVRNLGPETAPNAVLTNVLSSGVTFVSATHAKGTHTAPPTGETGTVTWYLGDMADQANEFTEIKVTVRIKGKTSITNVASVTADVIDPNTANNTASLQTTVAAGGKK